MTPSRLISFFFLLCCCLPTYAEIVEYQFSGNLTAFTSVDNQALKSLNGAAITVVASFDNEASEYDTKKNYLAAPGANLVILVTDKNGNQFQTTLINGSIAFMDNMPTNNGNGKADYLIITDKVTNNYPADPLLSTELPFLRTPDSVDLTLTDNSANVLSSTSLSQPFDMKNFGKLHLNLVTKKGNTAATEEFIHGVLIPVPFE